MKLAIFDQTVIVDTANTIPSLAISCMLGISSQKRITND